MIWWFRKKKNLKHFLTDTKLVSIKGYEFLIKKLDTLDYIQGNKVMIKYYETYTDSKSNLSDIELSAKKIRDHYIDVFCSGLVLPKGSRGPTDDLNSIDVNILFNDIDISNGLYESIIEYTYGKKKLKLKR